MKEYTIETMLDIKKNYPLEKYVTMAIGGPAKYFIQVSNLEQIQEALNFAKNKDLTHYIVGEGSNLIVSDSGFEGVVIKVQISDFKIENRYDFLAGAGYNLNHAITKLNKAGLSGLERMAGIPGTVGGAIYGCAGAYGQEIKDDLESVLIYDGKHTRTLTKAECKFGYRESIFKKHKTWIILQAKFRLTPASNSQLAQISRDIIKLREKKYKPGLRCPGSFFKNIKLSELNSEMSRKLLKQIPSNKIMFGKVPAGYLLETVGAQELSFGSVKVAHHHANLIYNAGGGTCADARKLAANLKKLVKSKFSINIEEEVQYL